MSDPPCRLKSNTIPSPLPVFANRPNHRKARVLSSVYRFFAGRRFDKISSSHHCDEAGPLHVAQSSKLARCKDDFKTSACTSAPKRRHFVVESFPTGSQNMLSRDGDVDFRGASLDGAGDLLKPQFQWTQARRESSGNRGDGNARTFQSAKRMRYHRGIDTDRGSGNPDVQDIHRCEQVVTDRVPRLHAKSPDSSGSIVTGE